MLKNRAMYDSRLNDLFLINAYNPKYKYLWGGTGDDFSPDDTGYNTYNKHDFVSVNEHHTILGWIAYNIDWQAKSAYNFGMASFTSSLIFIKDVKQVLDDIFNKYGLERIEWKSYGDNPAIRGYRKFIKRHGGREVGTFKNNIMLQDGKLHDTVYFEILKEDYKP